MEKGQQLIQEHISTITLHRLEAFGICLAILLVYDVLVARHHAGRWFNIHALANALTVIGAIPAMILWIQTPMRVVSYEGQESPDPVQFPAPNSFTTVANRSPHAALTSLLVADHQSCDADLAFRLSSLALTGGILMSFCTRAQTGL